MSANPATGSILIYHSKNLNYEDLICIIADCIKSYPGLLEYSNSTLVPLNSTTNVNLSFLKHPATFILVGTFLIAWFSEDTGLILDSSASLIRAFFSNYKEASQMDGEWNLLSGGLFKIALYYGNQWFSRLEM